MIMIRLVARLLNAAVDHLVNRVFGPLNAPAARVAEIALLQARRQRLRTELVQLHARAVEQHGAQEHWAAWTSEMTLR